MALVLEANYSKKIGLPGYSSHQFSITLKTEITDPAQIPAESTRLYALLQSSVDQSLQQVGWLPESKPTNGHTNGNGNGNGHPETWNCSDKQRDLIQKIVEEHRLDKNQIEQLAMERFGKGVRLLNKLEASGLIDELFEKHGNPNQRRRFNGRATNPR
jgi:hypothetical protein